METSRNPIATPIVLALALLVACEDGSQRAAERPLPNSLADTSVRAPQRQIPEYGALTDSMDSRSVRGQVLYVPVYSHIFQRTQDMRLDLTATLSIRNVSPTRSLSIHDVDYFDSDGTLLKSYLERPRRLGPLASTYVVIAEDDRSGGVGANFIVRWLADEGISPPLIEAVMIGTANTQGISFTSPARVLQEW